MSKTNHALLYILFLFAIVIEINGQPQSITLDYHKTDKTSTYHKDYLLNVPSTTNILKIKTTPQSIDDQIIFFLQYAPDPDYSNSLIKADKGGVNTIYVDLNTDKLNTDDSIYLTVFSTKETSKFTIDIIGLNEGLIEDGEEVNLSFNVLLPFIWRPASQDDSQKELFIYAIGTHRDDFSMNIQLFQDNKEMEKVKVKELFRTGYGLILDLSTLDISDSQTFEIRVTLEKSEECSYFNYVKFGLKTMKKEDVIGYFSNEFIGYVGKTITHDCYTLPGHGNKEVIINIASYPNPIHLRVFLDNDDSELIEVSLIDSITYKFPSNIMLLCAEYPPSISTFTTYSMEIFDPETIETKQIFIPPVLNGIQKRIHLPKGKAISFRRQRFTTFEANIEMNLQPIKGNSVLYHYYCKNYPCNINQAEIEKLVKTKEMIPAIKINDDQHASVPYKEEDYDSEEKLLGVVSCEGSIDCDFYYTMYCDNEEIELLMEEKYQNAVSKGEENVYFYESFDAYVNMISFVLYSYSGDIQIKVVNEKHTLVSAEKFIANRKVITFSITEEQTAIDGRYTIKVISSKYGFYSITILNDKNTKTFVDSGEIRLHTITPKELSQTYQLNNRVPKSPFLISLYPLNCQLKYQLPNEEVKIFSKEVQVIKEHSSDDSKPVDNYDIIISFDHPFGKINNENYPCMFYISGVEIDNKKQLMLSESVTHHAVLDKTVNKVIYLYPFTYQGTTDQIIIDVSYHDSSSLKITIDIENTNNIKQETHILNRSRKLLYKNLDKSCIKNQLCKAIITVEPNILHSTSISYRIKVKSSKTAPIYINKQQYQKTIVDVNAIEYYYTDIGNEKGEVILNFNKGNGVVFARIITKDAVDDKGYNKHVILPNKDLDPKYMIKYNYYQKKITYTQEDTKDCAKGCEIYIGVQSEIESNKDSKASNVVEFTILIRETDNQDTRTSLDVNEYAYGSLSPTDQANIYLVKIPFDSDEIRIHLISEFGVVYINSLSKGTPTKEMHQASIQQPTDIIILKRTDDIFDEKSLEGFSILIAVSVTNSIYETTDYALKVSISQENIPLSYLTSTQNEICIFDNSHRHCNLIRSVSDYEGITQFTMSVLSLTNNHNSFEIYANIIDGYKYETDFTNDDVPTSTEYDFTSAIFPEKDVLYFDNTKNDKMKGNYYIIISIYGKENGQAIFLSTSMNDVHKFALNQNTKTLIHMKHNENQAINLVGGQKYLATFTLLYGNGMIQYSNNNPYVFENSLILEIEKHDNKDFTVTSSSEELIYYVSYYSIDNLPVLLKEIAYGDDSFITKSKPNFSDKYYIRMIHNTGESANVIINYKFFEYKIDKIVEGREDFEINAYLITETDLIGFKKDPSKLPDDSKKITPSSSQYDSIARIGMISINLISSLPYSSSNGTPLILYFNIVPSTTNKNTYLIANPQINSYPTGLINSMYAFPKYNYYYNSIAKDKEINILKLTKFRNEDSKLIIEYASCVDDSLIDFSIRNYDTITSLTDKDLYKNDTSIVPSVAQRENGLITIVLDITNYDTIAFIVFIADDADQEMIDSSGVILSYVLKYTTGESYDYAQRMMITNPVLNLAYERNYIFVVNADQPKIAHLPTEDQQFVKEIEYIFRLYHNETNEDSKSSVCLLMDNTNAYSKRITLKENQAIDIREYIKLKENTTITVSLVALLMNEADTEMMLAYDSTSLYVEKIPAEIIPFIKSWQFYVIIGVCSTFILGVLIALIIYINKKRNLEAEAREILAGPEMPLHDESNNESFN